MEISDGYLNEIECEIAALKAENKRLVESNKKENANFYSAGLMCERILVKDEIEKLKAENEQLAEAYRDMGETMFNVNEENERLKQSDLHLKKWIDELQADKAELLEALKECNRMLAIIENSFQENNSIITLRKKIESLLSKHETK